MKSSFITCFLISFTCVSALWGQGEEKRDYELLELELEILNAYTNFSTYTKTLIDSAHQYALQEDYDFAIVFLEEAKNGIDALNEPKNPQKIEQPAPIFLVNLISGIDYNRQEFELGYEQGDSVLLDELNKPFIGLNLRYFTDDNSFFIDNQFRYDRENLQNELVARGQIQNKYFSFNTKLGTVFDKNFTYPDLGYLELFVDFSLKNNNLGSDWYWSLKNIVRYKKFKQATETIPNFIRNTFSGYAVKSFDLYQNIQVDYNFDLNESLNFINNDFIEHDAGIGYQDMFFSRLKLRASSRARVSRFNYLVSDESGDSSFTNRSTTFGLNPELVYTFNQSMSIGINYKVDFKQFVIKTEQEPDYRFDYLNPSILVNLSEEISLKLGYVRERKVHKTVSFLEEQYIKDQNYQSQGVSLGFDFTTLNGILIALNMEYVRRRYPDTVDDAAFSIYSNRNILNILLFAQIPISEKISINAIGSYDNDKDIDTDFNDSVSSFYSFEFVYSF
jgi:hypothetical protein